MFLDAFTISKRSPRNYNQNAQREYLVQNQKLYQIATSPSDSESITSIANSISLYQTSQIYQYRHGVAFISPRAEAV